MGRKSPGIGAQRKLKSASSRTWPVNEGWPMGGQRRPAPRRVQHRTRIRRRFSRFRNGFMRTLIPVCFHCQVRGWPPRRSTEPQEGGPFIRSPRSVPDQRLILHRGYEFGRKGKLCENRPVASNDLQGHCIMTDDHPPPPRRRAQCQSPSPSPARRAAGCSPA